MMTMMNLSAQPVHGNTFNENVGSQPLYLVKAGKNLTPHSLYSVRKLKDKWHSFASSSTPTKFFNLKEVTHTLEKTLKVSKRGGLS